MSLRTTLREDNSEMITSGFRRLVEKLKIEKDAKISNKSKKRQLQKKRDQLPDDILDKIFDYSSPFDVIKWRRVNKQFERVAEQRLRALLYLDVMRLNVYDIVPRESQSESDFYRHPAAQLVVHYEPRSILLVVHSNWTVRDAVKLFEAMQYFGRTAKTVTLECDAAELCMAAQCSSDIAHFFEYACASKNEISAASPQISKMASRMTQPTVQSQKSTEEAIVRWNPRTQRIPIGPVFAMARELSIRCPSASLRRLRRFTVYGIAPSLLFNGEAIQVIRVSINDGRRVSPSALRLRPFVDWLETKGYADKLCIQFC